MGIARGWEKRVIRTNIAHAKRTVRIFSVSPHSRSLFSALFKTFCLTARAYLNTQKYGLFCSLRCHPTFDIRNPTSDIRDSTSDIRHPTSNIRHPTSDIRDATSDIWRMVVMCSAWDQGTYVVRFERKQCGLFWFCLYFYHFALLRTRITPVCSFIRSPLGNVQRSRILFRSVRWV